MSIIIELASYDHEIINWEKKTKLLRTMPETLKSIAMVFKVTQMSFNDGVDEMDDKIERQ